MTISLVVKYNKWYKLQDIELNEHDTMLYLNTCDKVQELAESIPNGTPLETIERVVAEIDRLTLVCRNMFNRYTNNK